MTSFDYADLVARFEKGARKDITFLTAAIKLEDLFSEESQGPENNKELTCDANEIYIEPKELKKKTTDQKSIILIGRVDEKKEHEEKKKNYKPGPFALFYQLNEGALDKDKQAWYYKQHKDIIGPVSSYNMDKMAYYRQVNDETKVAYKTIEKFKKFGKIRKYVEEEKEELEQ